MTPSTSRRPPTRKVRETFRRGAAGCWVHPEWEAKFPWLAQGITGGSAPGIRDGVDFGLFTPRPPPDVRGSWEVLGAGVGFDSVLHSRQVHGSRVLVHGVDWKASMQEHSRAPGVVEKSRNTKSSPGRATSMLCLGPDADGHVTAVQGLLLGVTVADCVPVFLVQPEGSVLGIVHAGWRGVVAGVLEAGLEVLRHLANRASDDIHVHLGPSICGSCYEVGPEVHGALGLPNPGRAEPVDLAEELASRAARAGVSPSRITRSSWCTLCGDSPFYSHRRGDPERQVAFLGIRQDRRPGRTEGTSR